MVGGPPPRALGKGQVCRQVSKIHKYSVALLHVCHVYTMAQYKPSPLVCLTFFYEILKGGS